ncbi:hypothetical protein OENOO_62053 [Oenococcus oeni ATCC BAA-1163]|uniref:Uncharacterized protein n=1 Tax=Oenococcus oeni ATCC BAA-1163 TaxID=379360 RepID=A0NKA3_OENOE|nr:hypothetical protein [Oenococcus oeni]EAV39107.1 hypothetical protein OENOO_62053 [Oenococcus oeni ATCC BAA-1163]KDE87854.1 hypothetical protein EL27_00125 [Oenococcus oeni]
MKEIDFLASSLIAASLLTAISPLTIFADTKSTAGTEGFINQSQTNDGITTTPSVVKSGFYIEGTHLFVDGNYIGEVPATALNIGNASALSVNAVVTSNWTKNLSSIC